MSVDILIPAFNEADRIGATIAAARAVVTGLIIVADDGSTDGTADSAREAGADVILVSPDNRGKGAALNDALATSTASLILMLDADLGASAAHVAPLVAAVAEGRCDMAVAAFPQTGRKSGVGFAQRLARIGITRRAGRTFASPLSGQRCISRRWLDRLGGFAPGFQVEVALTLGVLSNGGAVLEIPLPLEHRKTGRTLAGFLHRARQARAILKALRRFPGPPSRAGGRDTPPTIR